MKILNFLLSVSIVAQIIDIDDVIKTTLFRINFELSHCGKHNIHNINIKPNLFFVSEGKSNGKCGCLSDNKKIIHQENFETIHQPCRRHEIKTYKMLESPKYPP